MEIPKAGVEILDLVTAHFVHQVDTVTVRGHFMLKVNGGAAFKHEWSMWFWFNSAGKIHKHALDCDWTTIATLYEKKDDLPTRNTKNGSVNVRGVWKRRYRHYSESL